MLRAGQFSLHHIRLAHGSGPNHGADRRIGYTLRYMPARCRSARPGGDSAMLVSGSDRFGHFDVDRPLWVGGSPEGVRAAARRKGRNVMEGSDQQRYRAVLAQRATRNVPAHVAAARRAQQQEEEEGGGTEGTTRRARL